jgi:hypothetical protein
VVRYLVIVGRREPKLHDYLTRQFAGDSSVEVVMERRGGERRQQTRPHQPERRRAERRMGTPAHLPGVRLVRRVGPASPERPHARSPEPSHPRSEETPTTRAIDDRSKTPVEGPDNARKQLVRWIEESRPLFALIPSVLDDLVAAEQECERLQQALADCRGEQARLRSEHAELTAALASLLGQMTRPMHELTEKLRRASDDEPA